MSQSLYDRWYKNGKPEGGPKTNGVKPLRTLRDPVPLPSPPPPPREVVVLQEEAVQPQPIRHGGLVLTVLLSAFLFVFVYAYFAGNPADASRDDTVYIDVPSGRQGDQSSRRQEAETSTVFTGDSSTTSGTGGGTQCPAGIYAQSGYLDGVQTDPACLDTSPQMRR